MTALQLARTPRTLRRAAWLVGLLFVLLVPVLLLAPWTQTVHGTGRAIAFNPVLRPQPVVSPIPGRVMKWHVVEGDKVTPGQRLVDLVDVDPQRLERLRDLERLADERRTLTLNMVADQRGRLANVEAERPLLIDQAKARLDAARTSVIRVDEAILREEANVTRETQAYDRLKRLHDNPKFEPGTVVSTDALEEARRKRDTALQAARIVKEEKTIAEKQLAAAEADLKAVDERTKALVATDKQAVAAREAEQRLAEQQFQAARAEVLRQENQFVAAPVAGTVFRVLANAEAGGQLVSAGQQLAVLVPDLAAAAPGLTRPDLPGICAELLIDGNDLPLVRAGDRVLVQFEGWAAVQFAAYPEAAAGTFEGRVYLVDPTSDGQGRFRILVEPAPGAVWPDADYLRQGLRAQGWVLARTVSVGYEMWRLLNGFPPAREVKTKDARAPLGPVTGK